MDLAVVKRALQRHLRENNLRPYEQVLRSVTSRGDIWATSQGEYIAWWRSGDAPARIYPQWRFLRELLGMVRRAPLPWAEKRRCFAAVMVWARQRRAELWRELRGTGSPAHATQARPASRGGS